MEILGKTIFPSFNIFIFQYSPFRVQEGMLHENYAVYIDFCTFLMQKL